MRPIQHSEVSRLHSKYDINAYHLHVHLMHIGYAESYHHFTVAIVRRVKIHEVVNVSADLGISATAEAEIDFQPHA